MMWNSQCRWIIRRDQPLDEDVLRKAVTLLRERHVALRSSVVDPTQLFTAFQKTYGLLELWRRTDRMPAVPFRSALARLLYWGFSVAWPRCRAIEDPNLDLPFDVKERKSSLEQARAELRRQGFTPPFKVTFIPYEGGALIDLKVTHMFSDGYSIVPLLSDLADIIAAEEAKVNGTPIPVPLPVLPSMLATFEQRLMRSIRGDHSLRDTITPDTMLMAPRSNPDGKEEKTHHVEITPDTVTAIRNCAQEFSIPHDIVLLAIVGVACAKLEGCPAITVLCLAPQRDGPWESEMVGLFADHRLLNICTEGLNYLGVALRLHNIVRERQWCCPGFISQPELPFINLEWTDTSKRHGFQVDLQSSASGLVSEGGPNPLKFAIDQPDESRWRMRVAFDGRKYSEERQNDFFTYTEENLRAFINNPLAAINIRK